MTDFQSEADHGAVSSALASDFSQWNNFSSNSIIEEKRRLLKDYSFLKSTAIGKSVVGTPIYAFFLGSGKRRLLISAAHHGNEWISSPVLLRFISQLCLCYLQSSKLFGIDCRTLLHSCRFCFVPLVNPDGVDIATGNLNSGSNYEKALQIAGQYPKIAFPEGWKANIRGVDLNLQYPAGWERAKTLKYSAGFSSPAPRDFVGFYPLSEPESIALYDLTLSFSPHAVVALHTQGQEIYWQYGGDAPKGAHALGKRMAAVSGYTLAQTPAFSDNAGYKDWFISQFQRPGFTVELGLGESPLPLSQLEEIYARCAPLLLEVALG